MKKASVIISYSGITSLMSCEQKYCFQFMRFLEKKQFVKYFAEGNAFQYGVFQLMVGVQVDKVVKLVSKFLDKYLDSLRDDIAVSSADEQQFIEIKASMDGMIRAYASMYEKDLRVEKHIANEVNCIYPLTKHVDIGAQFDNIIEVKGKWYLHEGKAWKSLSDNSINNIKNSFQIATYYYAHNTTPKKLKIKNIQSKPFSGIIFDAVQKPSIRKKKGEQYKAFLKRLESYYTSSEGKFYKEVIFPKISYKNWHHTITSLADRVCELHDGRKPIKMLDSNCGWCDFYELCYTGETKKTLALFKQSDYKNRYKQGG